jgi:hypothetical protein
LIAGFFVDVIWSVFFFNFYWFIDYLIDFVGCFGRDVRVIGLVLLLSMFLAMPSPLASAGELSLRF